MGKSPPVVSIITPTYNHAQFIGACIEGALEQTYEDWEMLIVDDGSTDGTYEEIRKFRDPRIRVEKQSNIGIWRLSKTYNRALARARGQFVGILEGDDLWPTDKLELQVPSLLASDAVLSYGQFLRVDARGQSLSRQRHGPSRGTKEQSILEAQRALADLVTFGLTAMPVTVLIRRAALVAVGGFRQPHYYPAVEHPTWIALARLGSFLRLGVVLGLWRRHLGQTSDRQALALSEGVARMNCDVFWSLREQIAETSGITEAEFRLRVRAWRANAHFSAGRYLLLMGRRREAMSQFRLALRLGDVRGKGKALLGASAAMSGLSGHLIEAIAGRIGIEPYAV